MAQHYQGQNNSQLRKSSQGVQNSTSAAQNAQNILKMLKKSQIDTTTGGGFHTGQGLNQVQYRQSRNNTNIFGGGQFQSAGSMGNQVGYPQNGFDAQNIKSQNDQAQSPGEFGSSKVAQGFSKKQYQTQQLSGKHQTQLAGNTQSLLQDLLKQDFGQHGSPDSKGKGGQSHSGSRSTGRRQNQVSQVLNPNLTTNLVQVAATYNQNNAGMFRDSTKQKDNSMLPPMGTQSKTPNSRNQGYKQSLSENLNGKFMKGSSPKNLGPNQNPSPASKGIKNLDGEPSNSISGVGGQMKSNSQSRTRNLANSMGSATDNNFGKAQLNSMRSNSNNHPVTNPSPASIPVKQRAVPQQYQNIVPQSINTYTNNMDFDPSQSFMQNYEPAKFASKKNGVVVSYAANTHQGIIRNYNEDRVSIILNIIKPKFKEASFWPRCSFFGVYDGHGGAACADYLRDQLHQLVVKDSDFPNNPKRSLEKAFEECEKVFIEFAGNQSVHETGQIDRSGSCAILCLIVGDICYVGNVGDSRAVMSVDGGEKILLLSKDHKPESDDETKRIEENGGRIYQNSNYIPDMSPQGKGQMQLIVGPHRVFPGRLSVSRTIGDIEAKEPKLGGNPKVVVPTPDIKCFKIRNNYDFILLCCDGVFEKLSNQDVVNAVWQSSRVNPNGDSRKADSRSIHEKCGQSVDRILQMSAFRKSFDNITAVMVAFENFENIAGQAMDGNSNQIIRFGLGGNQKFLEQVEEELVENEETETPINESRVDEDNSISDITTHQEFKRPIYSSSQTQSLNTKGSATYNVEGEQNNMKEELQGDISKKQKEISSLTRNTNNLSENQQKNSQSQIQAQRQSETGAGSQKRRLSSPNESGLKNTKVNQSYSVMAPGAQPARGSNIPPSLGVFTSQSIEDRLIKDPNQYTKDGRSSEHLQGGVRSSKSQDNRKSLSKGSSRVPTSTANRDGTNPTLNSQSRNETIKIGTLQTHNLVPNKSMNQNPLNMDSRFVRSTRNGNIKAFGSQGNYSVSGQHSGIEGTNMTASGKQWYSNTQQLAGISNLTKQPLADKKKNKLRL